VIVKLGLQSHELKLIISIGILSFIVAFGFLCVPEGFMNYSADLKQGRIYLGCFDEVNFVGFRELVFNINEILKQNKVNAR
jgi:hypothetical protein